MIENARALRKHSARARYVALRTKNDQTHQMFRRSSVTPSYVERIMTCVNRLTKHLPKNFLFTRRPNTTFRRALQTSPEPPYLPTFANPRAALKHSFDSYDPTLHDCRPLFVNDAGVVERQCSRWVKNLPKVRPFYAVKCNPDEVILRQLAHSNAGFDCATSAEIQAVLDLGVEPDNIIFANPVKSFADITFARSCGVKKMTFDNEYELRKIKELFPEAELVLRLLPDDSGSLMRFGEKFGASLDQSRDLLALSLELKLCVIGVSFHIGSGCFDPRKYDSAISLSRAAFDLAQDLGLPAFRLLDIGGGFPGDPAPHQVGRDGVPSFEAFATVIEAAIEQHFPPAMFPALQCISEPGRYFATAAGTLFTMVQGKRKVDAHNNLYYINDGVYGSFNSITFDHAKPIPLPLEEFFAQQELCAGVQRRASPSSSYQHATGPGNTLQQVSASALSTHCSVMQPSTIFGPTCDSIDLVVKDHPMREMHVGEWLAFDLMGAYTTAAASNFNGVQKPVMNYVRSQSV